MQQPYDFSNDRLCLNFHHAACAASLRNLLTRSLAQAHQLRYLITARVQMDFCPARVAPGRKTGTAEPISPFLPGKKICVTLQL